MNNQQQFKLQIKNIIVLLTRWTYIQAFKSLFLNHNNEKLETYFSYE